MTSGFPWPPSGATRSWDPEVERAEVLALLRLKTLPKLGDRGIWSLIRGHGSAIAALRGAGVQEDLLGSTDWEAALGEWKGSGIRTLPITSPHFPASLAGLVDPPPLLFLKGRPELLLRPAVAVVGARKATEAGRRTAEALGSVLGRAGVLVVSGMALGIDGAAHRGALAAGADTVAVLGSGLNLPYPRAHLGLFREIGKKGLLVSEFLPSEPAFPHHFPKRNRILAALARAVVVVEAGRKSGALITVDHALDLGRDVFAFPGSIENPRATGTNALLRDGARVLTSPEAILLEIPEMVEEARGISAKEDGEEKGSPAVPPELRALWASLSKEPRSLDHLARRAGLAPGRALAGLSSLELLGEARRCPGMRFSRG